MESSINGGSEGLKKVGKPLVVSDESLPFPQGTRRFYNTGYWGNIDKKIDTGFYDNNGHK